MEHTDGEQTKFWDSWINDSRAWETNPDNSRRAEVVLRASRNKARSKILEIGCGSGWLSLKLAELGSVTAVDIGMSAMESLRTLHPHIQWIGGDFLALDLPKGFDLIVCMETISHVADQQSFAVKIAELAAPSCDLILTTQNPLVWSRVSSLKPPQPGQLRNWLSPEKLNTLFDPYFDLDPILTCAAGKGDRGFFRLLRGRGRLHALTNGRSALLEEKLGLGCSLVLFGRRH